MIVNGVADGEVVREVSLQKVGVVGETLLVKLFAKTRTGLTAIAPRQMTVMAVKGHGNIPRERVAGVAAVTAGLCGSVVFMIQHIHRVAFYGSE